MAEFYEAYSQANLLYGLDLTPEDFEEIGMIAWNRIGNKQTRLYKYTINVDCADKEITLPCNCEYIEAVTYPFEDWNYVTNKTYLGDYNSQFTEQYIEALKANKSPYYTSGKYVKYEQVGNKLYFDKPYGDITILYRGVELDDTGLPLINEKEKDAIACFCAFVSKYKESLSTHNQVIAQEAQLLEARWYKLCDAARVKEHLS